MLSLFGSLTLILAIIAAFIQSVLPLLGYWRNNDHLLFVARPAAFLQCLCVLAAYLFLTIGFIKNDFSLVYVAENSHISLPIIYKLTAVWGAHEGSILLWIVILNCWTLVYAYTERRKKTAQNALTFAILGIISFSFLSYLILISNPFINTNLHLQGNDLNPLLQDPGLVSHPPILYIGYVGLAVAFAITQAALICKRMDTTWARSTRQFAAASWCFLTLGIALGSWWAYRVLGWGGFWFWDPVENLSLLPWLTAVALIHVMLLVEKSTRITIWAIILINICFGLSLLGTFLVRSGILISAHSFASDPQRGIYLLIMLGFSLLGSTWLLMSRLSLLAKKTADNKDLSHQSHITPSTNFISRDAGLLYNSGLFFVGMLTVLLGTLYPLIADALNMGSISVGAPYFNTVMAPLTCLVLFLMGMISWQQWRNTSAIIKFKRPNAMTIAHAGFAILMLSIVFSSVLTQEREVKMQPGDIIHVGPYTFLFRNISALNNTRYQGIKGAFDITKNNHHIVTLYPEKRIYRVRGIVVTKAAIHYGVFRDLYIALGQPLDNDYWAIRIYYKPFVCWIWIGALLIVAGGILSILTRKNHV